MKEYFIGIDIGTQGARVVLLDGRGEISWAGDRDFPLSEISREEQSPQMWWEVCSTLLRQMCSSMASAIDLTLIRSLAVTSTSGTMIPIDRNNRPVHNALMYSDKRSVEQAESATLAALQNQVSGYTNFNYSSGLAKMVWFAESYPDKVSSISRWIHAADYVTGMLSGEFGLTDYTNALKSGFNVTDFQWPEYIYTDLPIRERWLQKVVPSGTVIGTISKDAAKLTGLPESLQITVGITDGCASQVASGAINPGDWNTTIGTTMVIKGVTRREVLDPEGRVYSHRHPEGYWMPGGASNTGADWVSILFAGRIQELNRAAAMLIPGKYIAYPLMQQGERFPMISPDARGFGPEDVTDGERFTANMEGVAYLERYAYELLTELSGEEVELVYTAGGASNSAVWLKIRAAVLNKKIIKMKNVSGAVGAAITGASKVRYHSLQEAAKALTVVDQEIHPEPHLVAAYEERYHKFVEELKRRT